MYVKNTIMQSGSGFGSTLQQNVQTYQTPVFTMQLCQCVSLQKGPLLVIMLKTTFTLLVIVVERRGFWFNTRTLNSDLKIGCFCLFVYLLIFFFQNEHVGCLKCSPC